MYVGHPLSLLTDVADSRDGKGIEGGDVVGDKEDNVDEVDDSGDSLPCPLSPRSFPSFGLHSRSSSRIPSSIESNVKGIIATSSLSLNIFFLNQYIFCIYLCTVLFCANCLKTTAATRIKYNYYCSLQLYLCPLGYFQNS